MNKKLLAVIIISIFLCLWAFLNIKTTSLTMRKNYENDSKEVVLIKSKSESKSDERVDLKINLKSKEFSDVISQDPKMTELLQLTAKEIHKRKWSKGQTQSYIEKGEQLISMLTICLFNKKCGLEEEETFDPNQNLITDKLETVVKNLNLILENSEGEFDVFHNKFFRLFNIDNKYLIENTSSVLLRTIYDEKTAVAFLNKLDDVQNSSLELFLNAISNQKFLTKFDLEKDFNEKLIEQAIERPNHDVLKILNFLISYQGPKDLSEDFINSYCAREGIDINSESLRPIRKKIEIFSEKFHHLELNECLPN